MVLAALVTACRLAIWPTSRSPLSVKPTTVGVVRPPSLLGTIWTAPPSRTETQQLVVPKSIPIAFPIYLYLCFSLNVAAALAFCGYFNQGRPNKSVTQPVAGYDLLHDSVGLEFARRFSY